MLSFGFAFGSFVPFHLCFRFFTQMDPEAFWPHEGVLFMMKQEVVKRGWLSDAQSSKKLKGEWKKASTLGMHLSAKYSGAREPKFVFVPTSNRVWRREHTRPMSPFVSMV